MPGSCTVEKSVGVSEKTSQTLKGVIGAAFGVKDVWTVKAEVEKAIGREVNWDTVVESTKTFQFQAPKCGRYSLTVFRLQRLYQAKRAWSKSRCSVCTASPWRGERPRGRAVIPQQCPQGEQAKRVREATGPDGKCAIRTF